MTPIFWSEFGILFAAALIGGAAVMPYTLKLLQKSVREKQSKVPVTTLTLVSFLQTAVLSALAIGLGLLAAHAVGLGAPYIEALLMGMNVQGLGTMLVVASVSGMIVGLAMLSADFLFVPHWPEALLDAARRTTVRDNFLAAFYGGINEELLLRLFGFSVLVWLVSLVWLPSSMIYWIVNIVITILFGIGHLPALKSVLGNMPPLMITRTLLLNAPVGLLCGWLFWTYGIEAAIIAHFCADIVYHVFGTVVLKRRHPAN